jgi:hemolysin D
MSFMRTLLQVICFALLALLFGLSIAALWDPRILTVEGSAAHLMTLQAALVEVISKPSQVTKQLVALISRATPVELWRVAGLSIVTLIILGLAWHLTSGVFGRAQFGSSVDKLRRVDREFLPAALEILETPPSPIRISLLWAICLGFAVILLWAGIGRLDIHAVAQGRIKPIGSSKVVQSVEPGTVVTIHVKDGSHVVAGERLVDLDPTETFANRQAQQSSLSASQAEIARRRLEIDVSTSQNPIPRERWPNLVADAPSDILRREQSVLVAELDRHFATLSSLEAQRLQQEAQVGRLVSSIEARGHLLMSLKERVDMRDTLHARKFASRADVIDILQEYQKEAAVDAGERGQKVEAEAALVSISRKIDEIKRTFVSEQAVSLAEAERRRDILAEELVKADSKNKQTRLISPIAGTVQQLAVTTLGQVVGAGQSLMTIVPDHANIEVEAQILNQDIGFVRDQQPCIVKIEAFPFTRYGTIDGLITNVSRDAVVDRDATSARDAGTFGLAATQSNAPSRAQSLVFPVTISLSQDYIMVDDARIHLSPGMAVTVEIKTGERRVIDYVLSPLREVSSTVGRER